MSKHKYRLLIYFVTTTKILLQRLDRQSCGCFNIRAVQLTPRKEPCSVTSTVRLRTIIGGAILTLLWICGFLFIKPTLAVDFGGGILICFKGLVGLFGLLIIVFLPIFLPP